MTNNLINKNKLNIQHVSIKKTSIVTEDLSGQRCDQIVILFNEFSRGKIQKWIKSGELCVNNFECKAKAKTLHR